MSPDLNLNEALIFRIAHIDNLPWILDNGLHASNGAIHDPNYRNIGNRDIIGRRSRRDVPVPPGGMLHDYVPFYFTPFSIMLFNISTGYSGVQRVPNDEIVFFVSSLHRVRARDIPFVFTDTHACVQMAEYFTDLADLDRVDWPLLERRDFKHDPDDPGKKERYQAEALIWKHVPLDALKGVCCYTNVVEQHIKTQLDQRDLTLETTVEPGWYF